MYTLKIKVKFDSERDSKNFIKSIKPELKDFSGDKMLLSLNKNILGVEIKTSEKSKMRASFNSIRKPLELFNKLKELDL